MKKVALDVIKPWIAQKVTELLGAEDDIVVTFAYAMLENEQVRFTTFFTCAAAAHSIFAVSGPEDDAVELDRLPGESLA